LSSPGTAHQVLPDAAGGAAAQFGAGRQPELGGVHDLDAGDRLAASG